MLFHIQMQLCQFGLLLHTFLNPFHFLGMHVYVATTLLHNFRGTFTCLINFPYSLESHSLHFDLLCFLIAWGDLFCCRAIWGLLRLFCVPFLQQLTCDEVLHHHPLRMGSNQVLLTVSRLQLNRFSFLKPDLKPFGFIQNWNYI